MSEPAPHPVEHAFDASDVRDGRARVFLVEDDAQDAVRIRRALAGDPDSPRSFHLEHVTSLRAAKERLSQGALDVALLDLQLPDSRGIETLLRILSWAPELPVVVFTTSNADDDIEKTYDLGVSSYITKPSSFEGLMEVIRMLNVYWSNMAVLPAANRA